MSVPGLSAVRNRHRSTDTTETTVYFGTSRTLKYIRLGTSTHTVTYFTMFHRISSGMESIQPQFTLEMGLVVQNGLVIYQTQRARWRIRGTTAPRAAVKAVRDRVPGRIWGASKSIDRSPLPAGRASQPLRITLAGADSVSGPN